mgnify:CR=1 FL=1
MSLLKDLISTPKGKVSHTKFWANIAYATATVIISVVTYKDKLTWELFVIYLAVVGGSAIASKLVALRYGPESKKEG